MNHFRTIFFFQAFLALILNSPPVSWGSEEPLSPELQLKPLPAPPVADLTGMAMIPAGEFRMGSTLQQVIKFWNQCRKVDKSCKEWWYRDEVPEHKIYLDAYWIDIFEVTNEKYLQFVLATGHRPALDDSCETKECWNGNLWDGTSFPESIRNQPVVQVNWYDADAYCHWRGKRLPAEAEWEKAARGPIRHLYPWGGQSPSGRATYQRKWHGIFTMTSVGSYSNGASIYGIYDMAGNAWEWVADWYDRDYYKKSPKKNPRGPAKGKFKVVRGGSWVNYGITLHSALRRWSLPRVRFNDTGFRCAKDAADEAQTHR